MRETDNDKKKAYLWKYQESVRRIRRIESELEEIKDMKSSIAVLNDGMPHGTQQEDLSKYVAELDGMERDLISERCRRIKLYRQIKNQIKKIRDKNEKEGDVLFYRYIKGMDWWEIAERMKYSERQIHRFHGKALANLKITKDVIECQ